MRMKKNEEHLGRSMVEMVGVLAIVGFLTFGGIAGYNRANEMLKFNNLRDQVSTTVANIRSVFFKFDDYSSLNEKALINIGVLPESMISEDRKEIVNVMKGSVLVGPAETELNKNGAFIIIYNGLNAVTCRELIVLDWGDNMSTGFLAMTISKTGDLSLETSNLISKNIQTGESTFLSSDLPQALIENSYNSCDCGEQNLCSIAWKFL